MRRISRLIGNRVTERDVREYLNCRGYRGNQARFAYLKLVAIERPGWLQIFTFCVEVCDQAGNEHRLFGVVRDDERNSTRIQVASSEDEQTRMANAWSKDLLTLKRVPMHPAQYVLLVFFAAAMIFALLGALLSAA